LSSGGAAAAAAPVPMPAVVGCEWIGAIEDVSRHMTVCGFEVRTCKFAGKCEYTYLRHDGRDAHDRESVHLHLNLTMSVVDKQVRTIETQTHFIGKQTLTNRTQARTIKQQTERINELASTKLHLNGTVSDLTPLTSLTSDTIWFGGNQVKLTVEESIDDDICVFLYQHGSIESPMYRQIDVFFKEEKIMSFTDVSLPEAIPDMENGLKFHYRELWTLDAEEIEAIKDGKDVYVIIYR
jgi:hypothetical protein